MNLNDDLFFPKPPPGNKPGATYGAMEPKSLGTGPSGWVIERCCDRCKLWGVRHGTRPPDELTIQTFGTWQEALDALIAHTYGRHDRLTTGIRSMTYRRSYNNGQALHRPAEDHWDASWLLMPSRIMLSDDPPMWWDMGDPVQIAQNVVQYNLTMKGWKASFGEGIETAFGHTYQIEEKGRHEPSPF